MAQLYQVVTRRLNEQVKRNVGRFPVDFIFQLNESEAENLKSQFATSSWRGRRKLPLVFTEHGAIMAAIRSLMAQPQPANRPIGLTADLTEKVPKH